MRPRCHEQAVPLSVPWLTHTHTTISYPSNKFAAKKHLQMSHIMLFLIYKHVELTENNI